MVTIEQKLTLFSKLLNQGIKEEVERKGLELDEEYRMIMAQFKEHVDKEAKAVIESARRRSETKKAELISKSKLQGKRAWMQSEGKLVERFLSELTSKIVAFVKTPAYLEYLKNLIGGLDELEYYPNPLTVYVIKEDLESHANFITEQFEAHHISLDQIHLKEAPFEMLGGVVVIDEALSTRIDGSMASHMEEHREYIIERIMVCLREVGDLVE